MDLNSLNLNLKLQKFVFLEGENCSVWKQMDICLFIYFVAYVYVLKSAYFKIPYVRSDALHPAHSDTAVAKMLVGNKLDLDNIRDVSVEEGKSLAESEGLFFMETSALDSTNVKKAFDLVIREIYNNVSRKVLHSDSYKAELSANNRVSLVRDSSDEPKPKEGSYTCC